VALVPEEIKIDAIAQRTKNVSITTVSGWEIPTIQVAISQKESGLSDTHRLAFNMDEDEAS